ncbi:acyltransferase [Butyrivibrio sp. INlla16]|uniref:acyltransferase family protein n=1 Tax=Butyrivibrio sp. INlla16 TaxID=1520807 RepID=UPI000887FAE2|nr:acyltransferase [Butyrivibrio sp. INlla16]SDB67349.1 Peptidoglycan/LPS O-acetylase OafA/YrhL, contains acyltransferase and SGNH-hydrolase domains [Butyrivibrio sp. INlla16]
MNGQSVNNRIYSLQMVRAIAILAIVASHVGLIELGRWGVSVFFILSGIVAVYTYNFQTNTSSLKYALWHIRKIYPLHLITMFIWIFSFEEKVKYKAVVMNIFLLHSWVPYYVYGKGVLNGVSWFLSSIFFCYLLFPFTYRWVSKKNIIIHYVLLIVTIILMILIAYASLIITGKGIIPNDFHFWLTYWSPFYRFFDFFIGVIIGFVLFIDHESCEMVRNTKNKVIMLIVLVVLTYINNQLVIDGYKSFLEYDVIYIPTSIILILLLFYCEKNIREKKKLFNPLVYIGDRSGYIFLIHTIAIRYSSKIISNRYGVFFVALFISVALAEVYFRLIKCVNVKLKHKQ